MDSHQYGPTLARCSVGYGRNPGFGRDGLGLGFRRSSLTEEVFCAGPEARTAGYLTWIPFPILALEAAFPLQE